MENQPQKPDNFLAWSICSTILCCLPLGIVGIVYSSKVDSLWFAGQHEASVDAAKKAKTWTLASAIVGVVFTFIYLVCMFLAASF